MLDSPRAHHLQQLCDRFTLQPMHRFWQQKKAFTTPCLISLFPVLHMHSVLQHNGAATGIGARIFMMVNATGYIYISILGIYVLPTQLE